ncbi:MAG: hypothetical protein MJH10_20740 [Epibacterium sp.]|nr:hypothetical protein [Epibacterium sp.]
MQPPSSGFSALDLRYRASQGRELGFYGSYGLSERLTLGLDLNDTSTGTAHALAFLRLPLRQGDTGWQIATELAVGANREAGQWLVMQRYGLSVGRGVQLGARAGWVSADLTRESRSSGTAKAWKLDAALGLNARTGRALAPMLQIELHRADDGPATFAALPSLRLSRRAKQTWLGGLEWRRTQGKDQVLGIRLGLWQDF